MPKIAVLGAGLIGKRHAQHIAAEPRATLSAVIDPTPVGRDVAAALGAPWHRSFTEALAADRPDGVIIATPNQMHVQCGLDAVASRLPAIVEKPIADDVVSATTLVEAAERAGVPLLVGHHRRYNPLIAKAKQIIESGRLGRLVAVHGMFWLMKPDDYFDVAWRREKGAGPVLVNLIHDIDMFRHLCGEIVAVQAIESNAVRGHAVEDTAAIVLRFASGVLATFSVSDSVVAPWAWELNSAENLAYPQQPDQFCYMIGGTHGSLALPRLDVWNHPGLRSWWEPLTSTHETFTPEDPLKVQIRHFCDVIERGATPVVSGRDGLNTLRVIEAIKEAARTGATVSLRGVAE
jgi:predicted dehydrogenase